MTPALRRAVEALERIRKRGKMNDHDGYCSCAGCLSSTDADEALADIRAMPDETIEPVPSGATVKLTEEQYQRLLKNMTPGTIVAAPVETLADDAELVEAARDVAGLNRASAERLLQRLDAIRRERTGR